MACVRDVGDLSDIKLDQCVVQCPWPGLRIHDRSRSITILLPWLSSWYFAANATRQPLAQLAADRPAAYDGASRRPGDEPGLPLSSVAPAIVVAQGPCTNRTIAAICTR